MGKTPQSETGCPDAELLTEHEIDSYSIGAGGRDHWAASAEAAALKAAERRLAEMAVLIKDVTNCRNCALLVQEYQQPLTKQFRHKHEGT